MTDRQTVILGEAGAMTRERIGLVLAAIFDDRALVAQLRAAIEARGVPIESHGDLLAAARDELHRLMRQPASVRFDAAKLTRDIAAYVRRITANAEVYDIKKKPNPDAVFWPNPTRTPSRSLYEAQPYVERLGLIGPETPVGSAGSCFAMEIAVQLHKRGFNYVQTEDETANVAAGVIMTGYDPDNTHARFPANWGLLFNTPSFRQLAERAFGERQLPPVLVPIRAKVAGDPASAPWIYSDPFREGVAFLSPAAYEANRESHNAACREALMQCRVFIITLGLNECWEYVPDGSVLSRNPRDRSLLPFIRPRVLTFDENLANIQRFIDIIRAHNPDFTLIVTVSPIPLIATVQGDSEHIIAANGHGKSMLRAVAEKVVETNRDTHYFPSYELTTLCVRDAWHPDQRHVSPGAIQAVMDLFNTIYAR